jgi:RNA-directed DNA polymerase
VKFIEHRVADRRIIRLIQKWLKGGVSEEGEWKETKVGTPQGAVASPLFGNIYLHYVFDLWVHQWRRKTARGEVIVVRYADDAVLGFEDRKEAEAFPGAVAGANAEVRTGTTPGENETDRVRAIRGRQPEAEGRRQT